MTKFRRNIVHSSDFIFPFESFLNFLIRPIDISTIDLGFEILESKTTDLSVSMGDSLEAEAEENTEVRGSGGFV